MGLNLFSNEKKRRLKLSHGAAVTAAIRGRAVESQGNPVLCGRVK
jgi:hypothetical protein